MLKVNHVIKRDTQFYKKIIGKYSMGKQIGSHNMDCAIALYFSFKTYVVGTQKNRLIPSQ